MQHYFTYLLTITLTILSFSPIIGQTASTENSKIQPKLVVGIVVDQMRYDYLTRFYDKFSDGGFKRMMNDGYDCKITITILYQRLQHLDMLPSIRAPLQNIMA